MRGPEVAKALWAMSTLYWHPPQAWLTRWVSGLPHLLGVSGNASVAGFVRVMWSSLSGYDLFFMDLSLARKTSYAQSSLFGYAFTAE